MSWNIQRKQFLLDQLHLVAIVDITAQSRSHFFPTLNIFWDLKLRCVLRSYRYLHIHIAQPDPVTSLRPPASPGLQKDN